MSLDSGEVELEPFVFIERRDHETGELQSTITGLRDIDGTMLGVMEQDEVDDTIFPEFIVLESEVWEQLLAAFVGR